MSSETCKHPCFFFEVQLLYIASNASNVLMRLVIDKFLSFLYLNFFCYMNYVNKVRNVENIRYGEGSIPGMDTADIYTTKLAFWASFFVFKCFKSKHTLSNLSIFSKQTITTIKRWSNNLS